MKKPINLSFSKIDTYLSCPRKYKLQYIDYIIPSHIPSPFTFGSAIDDVTGHILFDKAKDDLHIPFDKQNMIDDFRRKMEYYSFQNKQVYVPTSPLLKYAKSDIDTSLLQENDVKYIKAYADTFKIDIDSIEDFIEYCQGELKNGRDKLDTELLAIYNLIVWRSLYNKGLMILEAFKVWADANIVEVHSIQKKIEISNEEGNNLVGYMDFEATLVDGIKYTLDLKTASNANQQYPDNCIETSNQLKIYSQESNPDVGYVVIDKTIRKKEPRVRIRTVYGKVSEEQLDKTFEQIDTVLEGIKSESFDKNKNACYDFGGCLYRKLCWENKMDGLEKRKFEDKR